jgi:hypothetical protein
MRGEVQRLLRLARGAGSDALAPKAGGARAFGVTAFVF